MCPVGMGTEPLFPRDILGLILARLSPSDLLSAAGVCSLWRATAKDKSQLRSWAFDDDIPAVVGIKASWTPMKAKTPLPKHWINPTAFSPLASFKTPRSLNSLLPSISTVASYPFSFDNANIDPSASVSSPRTPSPIQLSDTGGAFSDIVRSTLKFGRFLGEVDVGSSRLSDKIVQFIFRSCPNLHTLRLQHICGGRQYARNRALLQQQAGPQSELLSCGCGLFSDKAFLGVANLCPDLSSVTLVLQHVMYKKELRLTLAELGSLPKLHTLSVELRMPFFGWRVKSEFQWLDNARCTDKELLALINAGPPPLQALALNRCDLSESSTTALSAACPQLEAIDLHSPHLENLGWMGLLPSIGKCFQSLTSLAAAALGIFINPDDCHFETWSFPSVKRLRLEMKETPTLFHVQSICAACPKLESLHLIWTTRQGVSREGHVYPISEETILEFIQSL